MRYAVVASEVGGKHRLEIPDFKLKREFRQGLPMEQLRAAAYSFLIESIQDFIDARADVPEPTASPKELNKLHGGPQYKAKWISLTPTHALKVDAYMTWRMTCRRTKITETRLARLVGMSRMGVRNLFKLDILSELNNLIAVVEACGYRFEYQVLPQDEK